MGQITQIAFELRNITQAALDDESSSAEEDPTDTEQVEKRKEMSKWFKFCKDKIEKIEKVWNRKLEEPPEEEEDEQPDEEEQEKEGDDQKQLNHEALLAEMLNNIGSKATNMRNKSVSVKNSGSDEDLEKAKKQAEAEQKAKDDSEVAMKNKEYADNQYWKQTMYDMEDLDELLADVTDPGDAARAERESVKKEIEATDSSDPEPKQGAE